jgi:hypothetical protein
VGFSTTQAGGGIIKAGADIAAGDTRSNLENANAEIASQQAKSEMASGAYGANLARQKGAQIQGQQVSAIGANNLQQTGTPSQVVADTARASEQNALQTQNNALRRAWGFEVQGSSDKTQADLASQGGILSGVGALAGSAGSIYRYQNAPSGT